MINFEDTVKLVDRIDEFVDYIEVNSPYLARNAEALEIFEGDLADKVLEILRATLSPEYYGTIEPRVIPINFMPKFIDKLSQVYSTPPKRTCDDQAFIDDMSKTIDIDAEMTLADEYSNLFKGYALEPFISSDGKPSLRSIPFDSFLVIGDDLVDPRRTTVFLKFMGDRQKSVTEKDGSIREYVVQWYFAYSDFEIIAFDSEGDKINGPTEEISDVNKIGKIPFVYGNRSKQRLLPTQDSDLIQLIKMFPVLFTDLGGAIMYQCFTIMYGIDVDTNQIKMSPNAFWDFKSDKSSDKRPEIGTIKPEAQIDQVLGFIANVLGAWAESKSIKIGAIGDMDANSMASGVSKIIDNMDTFEVQKKSIPFFKKEEGELWHIMALLNNYWLLTGEIDLDLYPTSMVDVPLIRKTFSIVFSEPTPMEDRNTVVDTQIKERKEGFTTQKRAIAKINPDLDADDVDKIITEVKKEEIDNIPMVEDENESGEANDE